MDLVTFQRLEFPAVLERLAEQAVSPAGRRAARETRPWTELATIERHFAAVMEILGLLDGGGGLALRDLNDCSELIERLGKPRAFLEPGEWLLLRRFLEITSEVKRQLKNSRDRMPVCWSSVERLDPLLDLVSEIRGIFDDEGQVRDSASPELRSCRQGISRLEKDIEKIFTRLLQRLGNDGALSDNYVTERGGRRVLPVRAGSRGRAPGIAHDSSNSGETIFIEPMEAVEPGNRLSEERRREQEIVYAILLELARRASAYAPELVENRDAMVQLDLWNARARLAHRHGLHRPVIAPGKPFDLMKAHHPLLYFQDPKRSVPLDLRLEPENGVLIITGPNTGGKTTSLKTVGLLALMAQSAIPLPAAVDSRLPLFDCVLAEMGDDQSVSAGLSTFSAHIRRISAILANQGKNALVLLDELGKATDPLQAGALGRAILEALVRRGALTLVTTHLPTLKEWAHDSPSGRNASFRLDPRSHRPQYVLQLDTPGVSEAFTIALAEGLPAEIVEAARTALPREERQMAELLEELQRKDAALQREIQRARESRERADQDRREYLKRRADLDMKKTEADLNLEKEYKTLLDKAREDLEKRIANLPSRKALSEARESLVLEQKHAEKRVADMERREERILQIAAAPEKPERTKEPEAPYEPRVGDWVLIGKGAQQGLIEQIDQERKRAKIVVGGLTFDARLDALRPTTNPEPEESRYSSLRYVSGGPVEAVSAELNLVGKRVEDALDELDRYLDRAVLSHHDKLRIIHGYGTGALRQAVGEYLRRHPLVKSSKLAEAGEGGAAVTVISLK
jgi:DNA mismatch repair protein MutS2